MDALLLASLGVLLALFGTIGAFIFKLWWDERSAKRSHAALVAMGLAGPSRTAAAAGEEEDDEGRPAGGARRRRPFARQAERPPDEEDGDSDNVEQPGPGADGPKLGKKKLAKLQAKADAKAQREQEQEARAERKKQEEIKARQDEQQRLAEEAEEQQRQERLRLEREERRRRDQEEYDKLKSAFDVEEQGFERLEEDDEHSLVQTFLEHVRRAKVVYVEELAGSFRLSAEEALRRLQTFVGDGQLTGVFDERGKFIHVTDDELSSVAKFINQRGRVSLQELADYSNRLIRLEPDGPAAAE